MQGCGTISASTTNVVTESVVQKTTQIPTPRQVTKTVSIKKSSTEGLPSIAKEQEILAKLGYLPFHLVNGKMIWKYPIPSSLTSLWRYGQNNVIFRGGVMQFQFASGITVDGILGKQTWSKLKYAEAHHLQNKNGYAYVLVSENRPETLTLYFNGKVVMKTLANTGIYGAETPIGTFPVYLRYRSQTMQGTNPDGSHYDDPGIPYVSYFDGGCAVHGFFRSSYGYPQSLGCVELPFSKAAIAWKYMNYGTLVTVQS